MKLKLLFLAFYIITYQVSFSQTVVKLIDENGIFSIPCKVNGKSANFYFDTGASDVSISFEYFQKCIEEGHIVKSDILPELVNYKVANGEIATARKINIRELKIGDLILKNITASVMLDLNTPMLLGQSALRKFGEYSIDNNSQTLTINGSKQTKLYRNLSEDLSEKKKSTTPNFMFVYDLFPICDNITFDIYTVKENGTGNYTFEYDVTNNSMYDYNFSPGSIDILVEVYTFDNRVYSNNVTLGKNLMSGNSVNGIPLSVNLRNRKPKYVKMTAVVPKHFINIINLYSN